MKKKIITSSLLLSAAALPTYGGLKFDMQLDHADGIYSNEQKVICKVSLSEDGKPVSGKKVSYQLRDSFFRTVKSGSFVTGSEAHILELPPSGQVAWRGFRVSLDGTKEPVTAAVGTLSAPDTFTQSIPEPDDFDRFWAKAKTEVDAIPFDTELTEIPLTGDEAAKVRLYDVKLKCTGNIPVSGYLAVPKYAVNGSCPAIVTFHGAGVDSANSKLAVSFALKGALALDINAHGVPNGRPKAFYTDLRNNVYYCKQEDGSSRYAMRHIRNKDKYYIRGMYQRVFRALEYMKSRPEWNGKDLISYGTSQGGGQAIAGAALVPEVSLLVANVPAFSDIGGAVGAPPRLSGWPLNSENKLACDSEILQNSAYFDSANMAKRIRCESYLSAGLLDNTCPPPGICTVFSNLAAKNKNLRIDPAGGHETVNTTGVERINRVTSAKKSLPVTEQGTK